MKRHECLKPLAVVLLKIKFVDLSLGNWAFDLKITITNIFLALCCLTRSDSLLLLLG